MRYRMMGDAFRPSLGRVLDVFTHDWAKGAFHMCGGLSFRIRKKPGLARQKDSIDPDGVCLGFPGDKGPQGFRDYPNGYHRSSLGGYHGRNINFCRRFS